ncbi:hypothetical protein TCAL_08443 [Tigriopus californicus]|uniref:DNA excision repair protein ERCC-1 n=1 Tax=Tigriopus californicus TaxID=6832 RepID=A0A553P3Z0_TIGCA|nr:DNA excision repair protein ERCC-1-like [Tigriopus californicus]TRY72393.1 hypothetical protein TCAL_08443 [Tigriopus californicus]|eukprot:TCALIF_08443-PA protein Name:"Similar to ERCC1 DNA excision repair protein ERCC-1 (Homo sapiens)" AED:0.27 eAED:0.27 QI:0/-1/0/1/-1/1/1/0/254
MADSVLNPVAAPRTLSPRPAGSTQSGGSLPDEATTAKYAGAILVNARQRGNPILKSLRGVPWEFSDQVSPDFVLGTRACAMFLSVRYHTLNPNYIHDRLKALGAGWALRVLLVQVDVKEPHNVLKQLMRISILAELTLMLAWSAEEAGQILETYKQFENKPPDLIMEKNNPDTYSKIVEALTSVKSVNKSDAATLLNAFGTLENMTRASIEDLSLCPGFGPQKAQRLHKVLNESFRRLPTTTLPIDPPQITAEN